MSYRFDYVANTQQELDALSDKALFSVDVRFGTPERPAIIQGRAEYSVREHFVAVAYKTSHVTARDFSTVMVYNASAVVAFNHSHVIAWDKSRVTLRNHSIADLNDFCQATVGDYSIAIAMGNSFVSCAYNHSHIYATDQSTVYASNDSVVDAREEALVISFAHSKVLAEGKSVRVLAMGNAWRRRKDIFLKDDAQIFPYPKNVKEYCEAFNIHHDEKKAVFYKAVEVRSRQPDLYYLSNEWKSAREIGEEYTGERIEIAHLSRAISQMWDDISFPMGEYNEGPITVLEVEVDLDDVVMPSPEEYIDERPYCLWCKRVKILREIPEEEQKKLIFERRKIY